MRQRPVDLERLAAALDILATDIHHGLVPLPDALQRTARATPAAAGELLARAARLSAAGDMTVAEAWERALDQGIDRTALLAGDTEILRSLGCVLGRSLSDDQLRHLALARDRLAAAAGEAREEARRGERLRVYLGTLGAAALILFLW